MQPIIDKEKVIKGLEIYLMLGENYIFCNECPYKLNCTSGNWCVGVLLRDALELLKEQAQEIEQLEHNLSIVEHNINCYINGNEESEVK